MLILVLPLSPFLLAVVAGIFDLFAPTQLSVLATWAHPMSVIVVGQLLQPDLAPVGSRIMMTRSELQTPRIAVDDLFIALDCFLLGLQVIVTSLTILLNGKIVIASVRFREGDFMMEQFEQYRTGGLALLGFASVGLIDLTHGGFSFSYFEINGAQHLLYFAEFLWRSALVFSTIGIFLTGGVGSLVAGSLAVFAKVEAPKWHRKRAAQYCRSSYQPDFSKE
jgi:hypothetical protein